MKLKEIYQLIEIGNRIIIPQNAVYFVKRYYGTVKFSINNTEYRVLINVLNTKFTQDHPELQGTHCDLDISFMANSDYDYGLTHSHQLLQVMANVIGSIEGWIDEYKKLTKDEPSIYNRITISA